MEAERALPDGPRQQLNSFDDSVKQQQGRVRMEVLALMPELHLLSETIRHAASEWLGGTPQSEHHE